jgi:hypothetical protein
MAVAVSFTVVCSGGCYKRIVSVNNTPGYTGTVYESNLGKGKQQGNETLFQVEKKTYKGTTYLD